MEVGGRRSMNKFGECIESMEGAVLLFGLGLFCEEDYKILVDLKGV